MDEASLNEDLKRYTAARNARTDKETLIEMLRAKYDRIVAAGMVTDEESDHQIRELLDYEQELAADFRQAIAEPFRALASLCTEYAALVQRTEGTISRWTSEVHPNYHMDGKQVFDRETGKLTWTSGGRTLLREAGHELIPEDVVRYTTGDEPPVIHRVKTVDGERSFIQNLRPVRVRQACRAKGGHYNDE